MARGNKKVVLMIDDNETLLEVFSKRLSQRPGVSFLLATNPQEALILLRGSMSEIDLIMVDGNFGAGHIDGTELTEKIIEAGYTGMIIAMSSDDDMNAKMLHAGCRSSIQKGDAVQKVLNFLRLD